MYPINAASPERIAVGAVVQISDGAVQVAAVTVSVTKQGGAETGSAGTIAFSTGGILEYTPTQGETNATSFIVTAYKTGCIPVAVTIITTATAIPGTVVLSDAVAHGGTLGSSTATLALSRMNVTSQTSNTAGLTVAGNGSGNGATVTGGATGIGLSLGGGGTSGVGLRISTTDGHAIHASSAGVGTNGMRITSNVGTGVQIQGSVAGGVGGGLEIIAADTGDAMNVSSTGGRGLVITSGAGDAASILATAGHGLVITGNGTSKHGALITGGTAGTSDAFKLVAGSGGVGLRVDTITASGAVTLSSTLTVTGATTLTGAVTATNAANAIGGCLLAATGSAALAEDYAADGAAFTLNQGIYMIWALLAERARTGTTLTAAKLDGVTPAMTFLLDSATAPSSQSRAT